MKYMYWIIVAAVIGAGIGAAVYLNDAQPEMVSKIQYSHFESPQKVVETLYSQLATELESASVVMLGVMPGSKAHLEMWKTFLDSGLQKDLHFQVVVVDPGLPFAQEVFPKAVPMDLKKELDRFIEGAKKARQENLRVAVIVPTIYASQALKENPVDFINQKTDLKPLSLSLMGFPHSMEEESKMDLPCTMGANDRTGGGAVGCFAVNRARLNYGKKPQPGMLELMMDQIKERDYLVLMNY